MGYALPRLWLTASALVAGAALGDVHHGLGPPLALAASGVAVLARRRSALRVCGLAALALALGWLSAAQRASRPAPLAQMSSGAPRCMLVGRVLEGAGGLGTLASVARANCAGRAPIRDAGVVVFDDAAPAGATFGGEGYLVPLGTEGFDTSRRRLGADAAWEPADLRIDPPSAGPFGAATSVRSGLAHAVRSLGPDRGALLRGLTLGDTAALDPATVELFRRAGLSHLLAVSGSNVAIVLGAVGLLVVRLPLALRFLAGCAALALFVLVVGPEPSVLRAAAMGAVALLALLLGRPVEPLHALGLALVAVVGVRPQMVFSVGLQLSLAATAGLVLFARPLAVALPIPRPVAVILGATIAAQLAVAPVLVATFGELSLISPAANLLAVPAVAPATVLGVAGAVAGALDPGLGRLVVAAAGPFLSWILFWGERLGEVGWASVSIPEVWAWPLGAVVLAAAGHELRKEIADPPDRVGRDGAGFGVPLGTEGRLRQGAPRDDGLRHSGGGGGVAG